MYKVEEVVLMIIKLVKSIGRKIFIMINDNGGEFRWKNLLEYKCFYCEFYKLYQCGLIENVIGLLRQYIKRDIDLKDVDLRMIENRVNSRFCKVFDFKIFIEVFYNKQLYQKCEIGLEFFRVCGFFFELFFSYFDDQ